MVCNSHLELPFHWQIMKPNLQALLPGETPDPSRIQHHVATDNAFSISPEIGLLGPSQEHVFVLTYSPQEVHTQTHRVYIFQSKSIKRGISACERRDEIMIFSNNLVSLGKNKRKTSINYIFNNNMNSKIEHSSTVDVVHLVYQKCVFWLQKIKRCKVFTSLNLLIIWEIL